MPNKDGTGPNGDFKKCPMNEWKQRDGTGRGRGKGRGLRNRRGQKK